MRFTGTALPDVLIVEPEVFEDNRGFFLETFREDLFARAGIPWRFVQENHTGSARNVLRGLHFQARQPQGKLVRAVVGEIFDVAVDLRRSSPAFGRWVGERLSADERRMLWLPPGFAHGFYVLSEWAEVIYKVTDYYAPGWERTLRWDDPDLQVAWPLPAGQAPILSDKDAAGLRLSDVEAFT